MEGRIVNQIEGYYGGMFPKQYVRPSFNTAGQDSFTNPAAQQPDMFMKLTNIMPVSRGVLERRWGYNTGATLSSAATFIAAYRNDSSNFRELVYCGTGNVQAITENFSNYRTTIFTPSGGAVTPRFVNSRDWAYFYDGQNTDLLKWDGGSGSAVRKWGIAAPVTGVSVGAPAAGSITLAQGRNYFVVYRNSTTGHRSDLNPVSASTGPLTAQNVPLSSIPVSSDPQVDQKDILATLDGGDQTALYFLANISNATTTYTDSTTDATLAASNLYQSIDDSGNEHGVANNTPPPNCSLFIKHRGRVYGIQNQYVFFSKSIDDLTTSTGTIVGKYEESWPVTYFLEISTQAEVLRGLLSDGRNLYVASERQIHRISGDGPQTFDIPEVVFSEVGVYNQDVWQVTFLEGQPIGAMWLTPDLRVIGSDFNSYQDVGTPVQDVLNNINLTATQPPCAAFFASAQYDFYILAVATGANNNSDTLLVYDLRRKAWFVWNTKDLVKFIAYNVTQGGLPQLLFTQATNTVTCQFNSSLTTDTGTSVTAVAQTSWIDFADPTAYKLLNELEVTTPDSNMTITIDGASTAAQFVTPRNVVSGASLVTGPLGTFKKYLAGSITRDRFYRFTFSSVAVTNPVLESFRVDFAPINRL